jgi:PRTRC genetic system ThiF family protein
MSWHPIPSSFLEREVRIHVAGCGGNGSQVLTGLARLDRAIRSLGHPGGLYVAAFDPDDVAEPNIGRQLFSPADIGQNKAAVLIHRLNAYYGLGWEAAPLKYEGQGAWPDRFAGGAADLLITCVDSAAARREIYEKITQHRNGSAWTPDYWLDLGNRQADGQIILGQPVDALNGSLRRRQEALLPMVVDVFPELLDPNLQEDNQPSCSLAEALETQDLFINDFASREALDLLWKLFRFGKIDYHGVFFNRRTGETGRIPIPAMAAMAAKPSRRKAA